VLLLEPGDDHQCAYYEVPVVHAHASEDAGMRWDFFVRHYDDDAHQQRDSNFVADRGGVLYPRGGTLGGSTAISAMVTIYPHNSDWDGLADLVGDPSWRAERRRGYFERLERWQPPEDTHPADLRAANRARHGYDGWLRVTRANPPRTRRSYARRPAQLRPRRGLGPPRLVHLPNRPGTATRWRCSTAISTSAASRRCASSTPPCSRTSPAPSSRRPST
jgi:choline dehydrogenase-like flavoprotein